MVKTLKQIFSIFISLCLRAAFAFVSYQLFWGEFFGEDLVVVDKFERVDELTVIYPFDEVVVTPYSLNPNDKQFSMNVFEGLIFLDRNFNFQPGVAKSWGMIDELTWDFYLRDGLKYSDGSLVTAEDIMANFSAYRDKDLNALIDNISTVIPMDAKVRFTLHEPDPLFLNKISRLMISKDGLGTGPYVWTGSKFIANEYFRNDVHFNSVNVILEKNPVSRVAMLVDGEGEFLLYAPSDFVGDIEDAGFSIDFLPALEVQFLVFNFDGVFQDLERRIEAKSLLMMDEFITNFRFSRLASQFVSADVFGYSQTKYPLQYPEDYLLSGKTVKVALPQGLTALGEHIRESLAGGGVKVAISYLAPDKYEEVLEKGTADLFFLAFKSDFADSQQFFDELVVENGDFNYGNYFNEDVEVLSEQAKVELDVKTRRSLLQKMMDKVVYDAPFGIPILQNDNIYAFSSEYMFVPRVDGILYFNDLTKK